MNNIGITLENNMTMRFHFLNGYIDLKEDEYGAYAIAPGCGSGKTTNIKNLISLRWYQGILYSAFTKDEVNEMYRFCKTLVGNVIDPNGVKLSLNDILVLHSDYTAEGTDNNLWRNNPELLADKKIILCTHAKLLDEPLPLLINTNFNKGRLAEIIGPTRAATIANNECSLPRQWILIDEGTESNYVKKLVRKSALLNFGELRDTVNIIGPNGELCSEAIPETVVRKINHYGAFVNTLKRYSKISKDISDILRTEKCKLDEIRNSQITEAIFYDYEPLMRINGEFVPVMYSFVDMIHSKMMTHLLLFDGTSDITLKDSTKFKVLTYNNKYNGQSNINTFSFNLNRRIKPDPSIENIDTYLRHELNEVINSLENIIRSNNRTLIFTWMNLKADNSEVNDDISSGSIAELSNSININKNLNLPIYISNELNSRGLTSGVNFSIEYYGSGKDKAINDYREYDAVVLAGKYQVPNNVMSEHNFMYHSNISSTDYYVNRVVQAICRTRIRLHNGSDINVYFSNDWNPEIIKSVDLYMNGFSTLSRSIPNINEDIVNRLRLAGITPKRAEKISRICLLDSNILTAIERGLMYETDIRLNDIYSVLPLNRKEADSYKYIISYLKNMNILVRLY